MQWWERIFGKTGTGKEMEPVEFRSMEGAGTEWKDKYMRTLLALTASFPYAVARILEGCGADTSWFYQTDKPGRNGQWPPEIVEALHQYHDIIFQQVNHLREINKEILEESWTDNAKQDVPQFIMDSVQQLRERVADWPRCVPGGLPYRTLTDYHPVRTGTTSKIHWKSRMLIWDFKYDLQKTSPQQHARALAEVVNRTEELLRMTFGDSLSELAFVCIPASSQQTYTLRFHEFSAILCRRTGMLDAWPHVSIRGERGPVHKGEHGSVNIRLDRSWFKYRKVLLFDDVMTTGRSFRLYADMFHRIGAFVIGGVFIGKTISSREEQEEHRP